VDQVQGGRQLGQSAIGHRVTVLRITEGIPAVVDLNPARISAPPGRACHSLAAEHEGGEPAGLRGAEAVAHVAAGLFD
jgi:hypothetical protein